MNARFRLTLAQMTPTAGDLSGNAALAQTAWQAGRAAGAQLVALPEMFLAGTTAADLLAKPAFLRDVQTHLQRLALACADGPALAIGAPWQVGAQCFNAYLILKDGKIAQQVLKHSFADPIEARHFDAAPISGPYAVSGLRFGSPLGVEAADTDVAETLEETGAEVLLVPDSSPYRRDAMDRRLNHMVARVVETGLPLIYLNRTGGAGDDVFDGGSFALNPGGGLARQLPLFDQDVAHVDLEQGPAGWRLLPGEIAAQPDPMERDYRALVMGLRDQLHHAGHDTALLSLTGGASDALMAVVAADALGPAQLRCVALAGPEADIAASDTLARTLGCALETPPLAALETALSGTLAPLLGAAAPSAPTATADLQGLLLHRLRAGLKATLLSSEAKMARHLGPLPAEAVFADYAPLRDLYPSEIAALCRWRSAQHRPWMRGPSGVGIPVQSADEPDEDKPDLEPILRLMLETDGDVAQGLAAGHDRGLVEAVATALQRHAPLRARAAPGPRLTGRPLGGEMRATEASFWQDPS